MEFEIEQGFTKMRWSRMRNGHKLEDDNDFTKEEVAENKAMSDKMDAQARQVHNRDTKKINMGNRRATDCKLNRRVYLPKGRPTGEEAEFQVRKQMYMDEIEKYMDTFCKLEGSQKSK